MSFSSELIFYPESARDALLDRTRGPTPPPGWIELLSRPMTWTEAVGSTPAGEFIISTLLNRRVYKNPKILDVRGAFVTIEVTVDNGGSGTMRKLETQYIMITPIGTFDAIKSITACS